MKARKKQFVLLQLMIKQIDMDESTKSQSGSSALTLLVDKIFPVMRQNSFTL